MTDITDKIMSTIKVTPLLGVADCNRTSTLVKIGGKNVLLDCGLNLSSLECDAEFNGYLTENGDDSKTGDSLLPKFLIGSESIHTSIDCVIISHYHLDHSGALPYLTGMLGYNKPIYMTQPTKTIAPFVWRDCQENLKMTNYFPNFLAPSSIEECLSKVTTVVYSQVVSVDNEMTVTVYPSNQPLGPDIFSIEVGSQSIFYTGRCNLSPITKVPLPLSSYTSQSKTKESHSNPLSENGATSTDSHGDLSIKMNGCMLSFKIGQNPICHRQLSPEQVHLVSAVFNNLQYMDETNEDDFWQRIAYEMVQFSSPLDDDSKFKWKRLFYCSLRSCGQKNGEDFNSTSYVNGLNGSSISNNYVHSSDGTGVGKKKRKNKKAQLKNGLAVSSQADLMQFDSPEKMDSSLLSEKKNKKTKNKNLTPRTYTPDPCIVDDQSFIISMFTERLNHSQINADFWCDLIRDLKKKGKIVKSTGYLEEYFKKLSTIQLEIMKSSRNSNDARQKWPHFDVLNEIDLGYFFEDKWSYRNEKRRFVVTSASPTPVKSTKAKKSAKSKSSKPKESSTVCNDNNDNEQHHQANSSTTFRNEDQYRSQSDEETSEPHPIISYESPPEDLKDQLITITLFANRLKKTEFSPEFWKLLYKDFEDIQKPIPPGVNLQDHYKRLAEIQLDVMKTADNMITALSRWPFFMLLHDLPLDILDISDKWTYRELKPRFH